MFGGIGDGVFSVYSSASIAPAFLGAILWGILFVAIGVY